MPPSSSTATNARLTHFPASKAPQLSSPPAFPSFSPWSRSSWTKVPSAALAAKPATRVAPSTRNRLMHPTYSSRAILSSLGRLTPEPGLVSPIRRKLTVRREFYKREPSNGVRVSPGREEVVQMQGSREQTRSRCLHLLSMDRRIQVELRRNGELLKEQLCW